MKTITEKLSNGNDVTYQVLENGHSYKTDTPEKVVSTLEKAWYRKERIKVYYGNIKTGKRWNEENGIMGYVGFSTGSIKIPLLVPNKNSLGGGALLDNCIIKIRESKGKHVLYQSENFQQSKFEIVPSDLPEYQFNLNIDGEIYSRHKTERSAKMLLNKLL
jgi:hypothetical protein